MASGARIDCGQGPCGARRSSGPGFRVRLVGLIAAMVAILVAAPGCGFIGDLGHERFPANPDIYRFSAGDGVNVEGVGPLAVRNVLVVANEAGSEGSLVAAVVNNTDEDHILTIAVGGSDRTALTLRIPAESVVSFGDDPWLEDPPVLEDLGAIPGSMVEIYFQAGRSEGVVEEVPVLSGCLAYLDGLEPGSVRDSEECPVGDEVQPVP